MFNVIQTIVYLSPECLSVICSCAIQFAKFKIGFFHCVFATENVMLSHDSRKSYLCSTGRIYVVQVGKWILIILIIIHYMSITQHCDHCLQFSLHCMFGSSTWKCWCCVLVFHLGVFASSTWECLVSFGASFGSVWACFGAPFGSLCEFHLGVLGSFTWECFGIFGAPLGSVWKFHPALLCVCFGAPFGSV